MNTLKKIAVWTACININGFADLVETVIEVTDAQIANNSHYDLVAKALTHSNYIEPFVHFDSDNTRPIITAARTIEPLQPLSILCGVDADPVITSNVSELPVSLRDYACAAGEIDVEGLRRFVDNYSDSARQDEQGAWYVERGNIAKPAQQTPDEDEDPAPTH